MEEIKCPNCGSIYVVFLRKQGIFLCEDCNHRFTPYREFKPHDETVMGQEVLQERELTLCKESVTDKEFTPLRIFLSYGREDKYYPFIKGLKEDLKNKGHEVWLDIEHLKTGMVWAKEIEKGIEWASQAGDKGKFIFIMTPHSVRYPGADREDSGNFRDFSFCLNEITMAMEKGIDIFPIMLSTCKPPISIYHLQYLDMTDCLPLNQKQGRYRDKFNRLLLAVEEGKITYGGLQAMLRMYLKPVKFKRDIDRHLEKFTGRLWVFEKIDEWLSDPEASRVFWITGNPGAGKTAIASWLYSNREEISALYLCDYGDEDKSKPRNLATSIAYQLSERFPEMQNELGSWSDLENVQGMQDASKLFNELIVDKLPIDSPEQGQTHIILIDALDEITKGPKNEIASFISKEFDNLPAWLRIIITSRPEREVIKSLKKRFDPFFLDCSMIENIEDIRIFIEREFSEFCKEEKIESDIVKKIIEKSEGVFLYVEYVRKELKRSSLSLENVDEFPIGLVGIYEDFFLRQFPVIKDKMRPGGHDIEFYKNKCRPVLEAIASAREPLHIDLVSEIFHWRKYERREVLGALGSLFPSKAGIFRPFHLSVLEWLTNEDDAGDYFIDTDEGHATLADYCWKEYKRWVDSGYRRKTVAKPLSSEEEKGKGKGKRIPYYPADISEYTLAYLPSHLIETGRWDDLETVLTDLRYIEAKCAGGMTYNLIADYNLALESFPEVQEEIMKKKQHDERIQRWIREIIEYSRKWSEARERNQEELGRLYERLKRATDNDERNWIRHEIDNIMPSDEDNPLPEIPQSVRPWTKEEIRQDTLKIKNDPKRIDRVRAFSQFANSESHILLKSEYTAFPSFCIQRAYNYADSGPVANSAENIIESEKKDILFLRHDKNRPPYNPNPLLLKIMEGHTNFVNSISITPDGKMAVSGSYDKTLRLWDLETGECLKRIEGHTDYVTSVSATPDGKRAVSGSGDSTLRLWDLETEECLKIMEGHTSVVTSVSITPDGKRAVSGSQDKTLRLWDMEAGECMRIMEGHKWYVRSVSITPDGKMAVSGSVDKTLRLWDLETGECLKIMEGHTDSVDSVSITPDGKRVVSGSNDKTLRLWNLETGECLKIMEGHTHYVESVSVTPDGKRAVSGSLDNTLRLWDLETGECLKIMEGHTNSVDSVSITPDGMRAVSGSWDNTLRLWDMETREYIRAMEGHEYSVNCVSITPDGKRAVSGSGDKTLRLWDLETGECLRIMEGHTGLVWSVSITPDGKRALSGSGNYGGSDSTVRLWDLETGECLKIMEGHTNRVQSVSIAPDGKRALSGSHDKIIRLWDLETGDFLKEIEGHTDSVDSVSITPNGKRAVSGSWDKTLRLWDLETGGFLRVMKGHRARVKSVSITPDGKRAVSGGGDYDRTIHLWDLETGDCLKKMEGHTRRVNSVSITPDGKRAVSGSDDKTIRLWALETGECVLIIKTGSNVLSISDIRPDGTLVCGTESGDVIILKIINIPMKSPIITPVRLWLYEGASLSGWDIPPTDYRDGDIPPTEIGKGNIPGKWDENITALCLWCGKRFIVDDQILNTIYRDGDVPPTEMAIRRNAIERKIKMEPSLRPSQITDISIPDSAYNDPRLLSKCPMCEKPLRFNPFIVDNK